MISSLFISEMRSLMMVFFKQTKHVFFLVNHNRVSPIDWLFRWYTYQYWPSRNDIHFKNDYFSNL